MSVPEAQRRTQRICLRVSPAVARLFLAESRAQGLSQPEFLAELLRLWAERETNA